tara:strand:- start:47 stop:403 length:357 start_codon:yes stop_codon:yes gene_type:complete
MSTRQNMTLKKRRMLAALEQCVCIVSRAAKEAGIPRQTHYYWMDNDPKYRQAVIDLENVALDFAESCLFDQMREGSVPAAIFLLKTRGKKRGYIERSELSLDGSVESKIIEWAPANKK